MKFLVGAKLPPALARVLSSQGQTAQHVVDINMLTGDDTGIWDYAIANDMVVVTKDEDFAYRHSQGGHFIRQTNRMGSGKLLHGRARWPQRAAWLDGVLGLPNRSRRDTCPYHDDPTSDLRPPTANRQPPTANRQPPTANRQPPTLSERSSRKYGS